MISIITPYSREYKDFLSESLETVEKQNYHYYERIFWEYNDKPFNLARARNQAIATAKGKYIVCLDIDDKLHPDYLKQCREIIDEHTIVTTSVKTFGESEYVISWPEDEMTYQHFLQKNRAHVTSMFPKKLWEELKGYDESFPAYEDWDFWTRAAKLGYKFKSIQEPLFFYRQHKQQMTKHITSVPLDKFINKHFPPFE